MGASAVSTKREHLPGGGGATGLHLKRVYPRCISAADFPHGRSVGQDLRSPSQDRGA